MRIRPFQLGPTSSVVFGPGAVGKLGQLGPLKKASRIALVSDRGVRGAGVLDRVIAAFGDRCAFVDDGVVPDADVVHINALAARMREENVDALVAVGGGSVMDTSKCAAAVLAKGQPIEALEGIATIRTKLLPLVCVPTTAGTGSEATQFAVVKDIAKKKKIILMDQSLVPTASVLDPELLTGLPRGVTAATGVDAVAHAVEAVASKMRNPFATALAVEALRILIAEKALERSLENPADVDARGACLVAAHLAGQAISQAMLGACHAFAHALGALKGVPHGTANGIFLGPVMRANREAALEAYAQLGTALGGTGDTAERASFAIDAIEHLIHKTAGIPSELRDVDVSREADVDALTALTLADADLSTNPVAMDEPRVRAMILERW